MWLSDRLKRLLKGRCEKEADFSQLPSSSRPGEEVPEVAPAHRAPPGSFAGDAPTPSKLAVLLFYISCVLCVLGTILVVRSFFLNHVREHVID